MPTIDKRAFIYIRKSDEYGGDHPNFDIMKMNGFTVLAVRPPTEDPKAIATAKAARKAGLYPVVWETPKHLGNEVREDPIVFANRLSGIVKDFDDAGAYIHAIIPDNEKLPVEWHETFAPALAALRTRKKILSIDPLQGTMWDIENMYTPYVSNGYAIDIQCYDKDMNYYDASRCIAVVAATPGVRPWQIRVLLPPGQFDQIITSQIDRLGPIGIGLFAPNTSQIQNELPKWSQYITGAIQPKVLAYR